jgi:predicted phage terminase large subunit-like protein
MTINSDFIHLYRQDLFFFTWRAFDWLHPGEQFLPAWHIAAICHTLEKVATGTERRLVITVPPRHGKSICTSVALPAWLLGKSPDIKIMVASYGGELAGKHAEDFRSVVASDWYRRLFPDFQLAKRGDRSDEQITTSNGCRKAISVGGAATGFGADLIIIDDLMKAADANSPAERQRVKDFHEQTLLSRLNDKASGRIVVIQQRLHEDDLPGYLLETGRFSHLNLPAIAEEEQAVETVLGPVHRHKGDLLWPERESRETLDKLRLEMGPSAFSAQYQQDPTPPGGNRLRWEWFGAYDFEPRRNEFERVVQSWDTGMTSEPTSDYSVCTTWGYKEGKWHLLDVYRQRLDFYDLKCRAMNLIEQWEPDKVIIEKAAAGLPLLDQLGRECGRRGILEGWKPLDSKEVRFEAQMAYLQTGRFLVPTMAPWLLAFKRELLAFPKARNDDQVDSVVQFLEVIAPHRGSGFPDPEAERRRQESMQRLTRVRPRGSRMW